MKTIYILRHAKSDWAGAGLKDHDRPLNERGREAAPKMGAYLKSKKYKPEVILCSSARRTMETCDLIRPFVGSKVNVEVDESLYLAEPRRLIERLRSLNDDIESAMLIGHNPGLEQLANGLSASPATQEEERLHRRMREKFSTCALAVIAMPVKAWREVKMGSGSLQDFMRPKDL